MGATASTAAEHIVPSGGGQLQALLTSGQLEAGDRIVLQAGHHGTAKIEEQTFAPSVTITSRGDAVLSQVVIKDSAGWRIERLKVRSDAPSDPRESLVLVQQSKDVHLDQLDIASTDDTAEWSAEDWRARAWQGVTLSGRHVSLTGSTIRNVHHGISAIADQSRIENNLVDTFSGDGMRGLRDDSVFIGNHVTTCVDVDDNHDDGFQSWSLGTDGTPGEGVVRNVRLEGNLIVEGVHTLGCNLQGIGLFGGFYENWVIRGNTVIVDHWHGITVMGGRNVVVSDNIVVDAVPGRPGPPWITITQHFDGRPSQDSRIERNVTFPWAGGPSSPFGQPQEGVTLRGNIVVGSAEEAFATGAGASIGADAALPPAAGE